MDINKIVPIKEQKEIRNEKIREFFKMGYTMAQICKLVNCSQTTVFFAIRGRKKQIKNI